MIIPISKKPKNGLEKATANIGIYKSWADVSTICSKSLINFSSGWTSKVHQQFLTSAKYFQSAAVVCGRNAITQPS